MNRAARLAEFALLYFGTPLALLYVPMLARRWFGVELGMWVIPALVLIATAVVMAEAAHGRLRPAELFSWRAPAREWALVLGRFAVCAALLWALLKWRHPELLWSFPRQAPAFWLVVMVCYPLVSVSAQGVLYRWYFERRYAAAFPGRWSLLAGAVAFAFAHVIFRNPWALLFTFAGGLLFLPTYRRTGSMLLANAEHALYGDFLFTVGWGSYFYEGTQAMAAAVAG